MFEAKSIYLGGSIIESFDCDYDSYKELGLVCPFCNSVVYLCKGSVREIKKDGKIYSTRPYFSHYSNSDNQCEIRALTKDGKKILEQIKVESRNQRFIYFEKHFNEKIVDAYKITKKELRQIDKTYGRTWLIETARRLQRTFYDFADDTSQYLKNIIEDLKNDIVASNEDKLMNDELDEFPISDRRRYITLFTTTFSGNGDNFFMISFLNRKYFLNCNLDLHKLICEEVFYYLRTRKFAYERFDEEAPDFMFINMLKIALFVIDCQEYKKTKTYDDVDFEEILNGKKDMEYKKNFEYYDFLPALVLLLVGVPWGELLKPNINNDNQVFSN